MIICLTERALHSVSRDTRAGGRCELKAEAQGGFFALTNGFGALDQHRRFQTKAQKQVPKKKPSQRTIPFFLFLGLALLATSCTRGGDTPGGGPPGGGQRGAGRGGQGGPAQA